MKESIVKQALFMVTLVSASLLYAMQPSSHVRVIPVSFNKSTNQWNVLLSKQQGAYWNALSLPKAQGTSDLDRAKYALKVNTGNPKEAVYQTSKGNVFWDKGVTFQDSQSHDTIYIVPVRYVSVLDIKQVPNSNFNIDFVWLPAANFLGQADVSEKGTNIDRGFLRRFRAVWPQVNLSAPVQPVLQPTTYQPAITTAVTFPSNWLQIPGAVLFYDKSQPYYEFTNFYQLPITIGTKVWPTTEHYFQAMKFSSGYDQEAIRNMPQPRHAFDYAKKAQLPLNWHAAQKYQVMLTALRAKFQNAQLQQLLLGTGNKILVENAGANDATWGAGANGLGDNHLGRLLMLVREELRQGRQLQYDPVNSLSFQRLQHVNFDPSKAL